MHGRQLPRSRLLLLQWLQLQPLNSLWLRLLRLLLHSSLISPHL